jgi:hypothetical protein
MLSISKGSHHFVKGSKNVLVPQPSSDKHDPLVRYFTLYSFGDTF